MPGKLRLRKEKVSMRSVSALSPWPKFQSSSHWHFPSDNFLTLNLNIILCLTTPVIRTIAEKERKRATESERRTARKIRRRRFWMSAFNCLVPGVSEKHFLNGNSLTWNSSSLFSSIYSSHVYWYPKRNIFTFPQKWAKRLDVVAEGHAVFLQRYSLVVVRSFQLVLRSEIVFYSGKDSPEKLCEERTRISKSLSWWVWKHYWKPRHLSRNGN